MKRGEYPSWKGSDHIENPGISKWVQLWFLNVLLSIAAMTCNAGLSHEATLLAMLLLYRGSEEG